MYEARQNKEKVSRRIDGRGNNEVRQKIEFNSFFNAINTFTNSNKTKTANILPLQLKTKIIEGIEVTVSDDFTKWEQEGVRWHINWKDVYKDNKNNMVYHLTNEDSKSPKKGQRIKHYYFCLDGSTISDPSNINKARRLTGMEFSKFSNTKVKNFIERNINELREA